MALETITANLANGYKQLEPDSFQTSAEITAARRAEIASGAAPDLVNKWFWTANLGLYRDNGREPQYGIGGRQAFNTIAGANAGANIDNFCRQLTDNHNYTLTPEQTEQLASLDDIAWVNPADLKLQGKEKECRYFEINPKSYADLNTAQRAFAQAAYGTEDFEQNMQMFAQAGKKPRIYVLSPDYVKEKVKQGQAIARACWLDYFGSGSYFGADTRDVGSNDGGLRGVRVVREADAQNLVSLPKDGLLVFLEKYVAPVVLEQAKEDVAKLYQ